MNVQGNNLKELIVNLFQSSFGLTSFVYNHCLNKFPLLPDPWWKGDFAQSSLAVLINQHFKIEVIFI